MTVESGGNLCRAGKKRLTHIVIASASVCIHPRGSVRLKINFLFF